NAYPVRSRPQTGRHPGVAQQERVPAEKPEPCDSAERLRATPESGGGLAPTRSRAPEPGPYDDAGPSRCPGAPGSSQSLAATEAAATGARDPGDPRGNHLAAGLGAGRALSGETRPPWRRRANAGDLGRLA